VQEGKRIRTTFLEVRVIASLLVYPPGMCTRVGLIVPRFRQSAVARNRVKRRLLELSRTRILPSGLAADVVIRIRPEAYQAVFAELAFDIERALTELARWRENRPELASEMPDGVSGLPSDDT
jgi:ribonuclease P protein component